jgi:hypothetical protein
MYKNRKISSNFLSILSAASVSPDLRPSAPPSSKPTLLEKLEKYEAAAQKRFLLMQKLGPLASIKHNTHLSPKKSSVSVRVGRGSVLSPMRAKMTISPTKPIVAPSPFVAPLLSSLQSPQGLSAIPETGGGPSNLVITREQKEKFQAEFTPKGLLATLPLPSLPSSASQQRSSRRGRRVSL